MNSKIFKLQQIANKPSRKIIGLMSGTSVDGLDIALCNFTNSGSESKVLLEQFITIPYSDLQRAKIRAIMSQRQIDLQELTLLNEEIAIWHGNFILEALSTWGIATDEVDLIASHGQTIFHAPKRLHNLADRPNATLQIGDGDHIAQITGIITLADFRQKNIAAGGEGAPLVLYGDYLLYHSQEENRILLNMGGIANFTWLPKNKKAKVLATDTGPGNTLLDAFARKLFNEECDRDGQYSRQGQVVPELLTALKANEFFNAYLPKTTGPELLSIEYVEDKISELQITISDFDLMATLVAFTAQSITECIKIACQDYNEKIDFYLSGGGAHHPIVVNLLKAAFPDSEFKPFSQLAFTGDAKEAVLFAALANEAVAGDSDKYDLVGVPKITMGKICLPN
jgi:anhydro-N-acetylmuramic acid kinase